MTTFFQGGAAMQLLTENDFIDDGPFTIDDISHFRRDNVQNSSMDRFMIWPRLTVFIRQSAFPSPELLPIILMQKTADVKCIWLHLPSLYKTISKIM